MDQLMIEIREKQKSHMIAMAQVIRDILHHDRAVTAYVFLSDQSTPFTMTAHWPIFFGVKTPFVSGMSTIAVRQSIPIYYFNIEKVKRGFYQAKFTLLVRDPQNYSPDEITSMYSKKVEEDILNQPACWLWTHKRWKRVLPY
jgi:KDO2-lipid IV(A) lauroyltransferase